MDVRVTIAAAAAAALSVAAPVAGKTGTACLVPLGRHDRSLLADAAAGIRALYGVEVRTLPGRAMPASAWYAPRGRHRAERLLEALDRDVADPGCDWLVGFTSQDVSTTKGEARDWGVFGLGEIGGRSCVVSTFRLARGGQSAARVRERTIKVVNHELGHVLGLPHCPRAGCLMQDAAGTVRTVDGESGSMCEACRDRLRRSPGLSIPERFEWPAPASP
ncbi:MAG: hypothetical protein FJ087_08930 [Deltaproteobacteria bacterium]|nr:hypothetical protein [Deltaproteobacteria bacterium]